MRIESKEHREQVDLVTPYGGKLINLIVEGEEHTELAKLANALPSIQLSPRSLCDIELLAVGAFSPLDRFMGEADYSSVLQNMRLSTGPLFPIPITLPVEDTRDVQVGKSVALRTSNNELIAVMNIEEVFEWDLSKETEHVCGTTDTRHPLVAEMSSWGRVYVSGPIRVIALPRHYDFVELRKAPAELRGLTAVNGICQRGCPSNT